MPAPRPRFVVRGRFAQAYMPKEYDAWKDRAVEFVRGVNDRPLEPFTGPCAAHLTVRVAKPKTTKLEQPAPDVDNYAKAVLDAITQSGVFWADDKQVTTLVVHKTWANADETPGVEVSIIPRRPVLGSLVKSILGALRRETP